LQVHHARPGIHHVRQRRVRRPGLRPRLLRSTPIPAFLAHASGTAGPLHSSATHCAMCDLPFPEAWVCACACACGNGQLEGETPCSMRVGCDETRDRARPLTARLHGCPSWMQVSRRVVPRRLVVLIRSLQCRPCTPPRSAGATTPTVAARSSSRTTARHKHPMRGRQMHLE
jgi:hypothetical protein